MERVESKTADYERMYEAAVEMARSLIRETNAKGEKILRLRAEVRELREKVEELRYNPYHDPTNGRFTSPNGGNGGTLYVGKGQAGNGTYILENEFDDEEYGKWLNNKIQTARAGRLQALVQNGRKAVEENPDIGKPKRDGSMKSIEYVYKDVPKYEISAEKKLEYNRKALSVYRNEVARYEAESSDMKKLYWNGRISRGQYYSWKWRYDAAKMRLQEVENESKVLSGNTELREKEKDNIFAGTIIAVEFDGTIAHTAYPKILSPVYETIEFLWKAKSDGAIIILWTCREGEALKQAVEWCEKTGVPIDYVNENAPERAAKYGNNSRKISADIYIDDRAVGIADIVEYENAEELRFNPNHDPKNGRFTSGNGVDISGGSGIIEPSPTGANELQVKGFKNKQKLYNHWKNGRTHRDEYLDDGITTAEQYEKRAVELLEMPVGGNILGHLDKDNQIVRYDKAKNDFVKGSVLKGVKTMFKPKDGYSYYENQRTEDIKHGGKA